MRVLVDTCVWSEALRRNTAEESAAAGELRNLVLDHRVEIIGAIRQELLSGLKEQAQFDRLASHLDAFQDIALEKEDHVTAARFFNTCRVRGIQGSNTDFLICAVASRRDLAIYTTDMDFQLFKEHLPIVLYKPCGMNF